MVTGLAAADDGTVWIGTFKGIYSHREGVLGRHPLTSEPMEEINVVTVDRRGNPWFGTYDEGLLTHRDGVFAGVAGYGDLESSGIRAIFEDREENLWLGTARGELHRFRDGFLRAYTEEEGLPDPRVHAILEDRRGGIWMGTATGLCRLDRATDGIDPRPLGDTAVGRVVGLAVDGRDRLWVGRKDDYLLVDRDRTESRRPSPEEILLWFPIPATTATGDVWLGNNGRGLVRVWSDGRADEWRVEGLPSNTINHLLPDAVGGLYVATDKGLHYLKDDRLSTVPLPPTLPTRMINAVHLDGRGILWLGTEHGLVRLENGASTRYGEGSGLHDRACYGIVEDGFEHLWVATGQGLCRVSLVELDAFADGRLDRITSTHLTEKDGLPTRAFEKRIQPCRSRDGRLWFPSSRGAVVIDPGRISRNEQPPRIVIDRVTVGRDARRLVPNEDGRYVIEAGARRLQIHYAALSYIRPEMIRFRTWLEGFDDEWVDAGGQRLAAYTALSPGRYRFRVIAANEDGVWNGVGAVLDLELHPHFHQTLTFKLLVILAVVALAVSVPLLRVRHLKRREADLSREVERTVGELKTLRGMLPICASCKKIRDDKGYWRQIEGYIRDRSEAEFSHGICPDCCTRLYPDFDQSEVGDA